MSKENPEHVICHIDDNCVENGFTARPDPEDPSSLQWNRDSVAPRKGQVVRIKSVQEGTLLLGSGYAIHPAFVEPVDTDGGMDHETYKDISQVVEKLTDEEPIDTCEDNDPEGPKDRDGRPIRIGDWIENIKSTNRYKVIGIHENVITVDTLLPFGETCLQKSELDLFQVVSKDGDTRMTTRGEGNEDTDRLDPERAIIQLTDGWKINWRPVEQGYAALLKSGYQKVRARVYSYGLNDWRGQLEISNETGSGWRSINASENVFSHENPMEAARRLKPFGLRLTQLLDDMRNSDE